MSWRKLNPRIQQEGGRRLKTGRVQEEGDRWAKGTGSSDGKTADPGKVGGLSQDITVSYGYGTQLLLSAR